MILHSERLSERRQCMLRPFVNKAKANACNQLEKPIWKCQKDLVKIASKMASDIDERMRKVLSHLDPNLPSANIYPALVAIRTK